MEEGTQRNYIDLQVLENLQRQQTERLHSALINGTAWEETAALREELRAITVALYKMRNPSSFDAHPAASALRDEPNQAL